MTTNLSPNLLLWSWGFLILYISAMLAFGYIGQKKVTNADEFATARGGYGPIFLAFAYSATAASGATFIGIPGIAYSTGLPALWVLYLYPVGVYVGVMICMTIVAKSGNKFGSRSIPEYLGDRFQSDSLRLLVAIFSLLLFFYLAGQLVSCLVMFQTMLGLSKFWALLITCGVLAIYVVSGGAHADILTDGVQGILMLILSVFLLVLFLIGFGIDGGLTGLIENLRHQNPDFVGNLNPESPLVSSWWSIACLILATIPLGLLPHLGNKLWALKDSSKRSNFIAAVFIMGMLLPSIGLGGLLARAIFGDDLISSGAGGNAAIPTLFIELFPAWAAALLGAAVLAAVMSTADGLVISSSQVIANDLYRRTLAPRFHHHRSTEQIEVTTLRISRWATVATLLISALLAWKFVEMNVLLLVWVGLGGMMAALSGPLVLGLLWRGVTRAGAISGFVAGVAVFSVTHTGALQPQWFADNALLHMAVTWLANQAPNPYSCTVLGELASIFTTTSVSLCSEKLPASHVRSIFDDD